MPKETFYNIKLEKQNKIIDIGEQLFSKYLFDEIDVKTIVEAVGIPRGSFYAYFDDISDYYKTVIKTLQDDRVNEVLKIKKGNAKNIFEVLIKLFESDMNKSLKSEKKLLIQHYFRYTLTHSFNRDKSSLATKGRPIFLVLSDYKVDFNLSEKDWIDFIDFCMNTYLLTYIKAIDESLTLLESVELFKNRIKIIERGIK